MNKNAVIRIAVLGAGLVGVRHARHVVAQPGIELVAIIDPNPDKASLAEELGCSFLISLDQLNASDCDGVIIATPNADHLASGLKCCELGLPSLIEKPIADSVENGEKLASAFEEKELPLLVGHHRRYHPFVARTKEIIDNKELGEPVIASTIWAVRKPDDYFQKGVWRTKTDGGPLLINFIHEADLLLHIFGEIDEFKAFTSQDQRGLVVEDTAVLILRFKSGLLATVSLSDAALTPWSFEGASAENPNIAETGISSWRIGCTNGSLEFPAMDIWSDKKDGVGDWSKTLKMIRHESKKIDPLSEQLSHFADLIRGKSTMPKCSGQDGINALKLVDGIKRLVG